MVSSLVALSTMWTGVVTLPQSCSSPAIFSSERAFRGVVDRLGEHHGELRHALAVAAGIGRFLVDRVVDEVDEGLEQLLELIDEHPVAERHGGLGCERLGPSLVG